jgi:ABC-type transport system involved in cytochrome bd biosynthesis fused ATPase/permease subunit
VDSAGSRISMQPEKESQLQYHVHHVPRDPLLTKESIAYNIHMSHLSAKILNLVAQARFAKAIASRIARASMTRS